MRQMGMSVTDFRNRQRISRFLGRYASADRQNLLTTALEAGFNSYAQFYRVFRDSTGFSPAEFRRRMK